METMRITDIQLWEAFYAVAIHGNFTKASKALNLGTPQLSKRVNRLEEQLGVRLLTRSTRTVTLTNEGRSLLPRITSVLDELSGLESVFDNQKELSGTIRITSVPFVAHRLLLPLITAFMKKHPKIQIDLELSEGMVNLVETNTDIALRIHHEPDDSSLVYKKLVPNQLVFCASPAYVKKAGSPIKKPADLSHHPLLMLDVHKKCRFVDSAIKLSDLVKPPKLKCNNGWFLTEQALNGDGILLRSSLDVKSYLEKGSLVQVLKSHSLEPFGNIYAVVPSRKFLAPRVRVFLDFLNDWISKS
jgi:LysR family transcriptional activator of dmlA